MLICLKDELALLFTGSKAPASAHTGPAATPECSTDPEGEDTVSLSLDHLSLTEPGVAEQLPAFPIQTQPPQIHPLLFPPSSSGSGSSLSEHALPTLLLNHPLFSVDHLGVDRRLIVNRKRKVKMHRVWVQGIFRKV